LKPRSDIPKAAEFGKIRSYLAKIKIPQADIKALVKDTNTQSRGEIVEALKVWLKG